MNYQQPQQQYQQPPQQFQQFQQQQYQQPQFQAPPQQHYSPPPQQTFTPAPQQSALPPGAKDASIYLFLNIIGMSVGLTGIHEIYLGNMGKGILQLFLGSYWVFYIICVVTFGVGFIFFFFPLLVYIWCIIDLVNSQSNVHKKNVQLGFIQ